MTVETNVLSRDNFISRWAFKKNRKLNYSSFFLFWHWFLLKVGLSRQKFFSDLVKSCLWTFCELVSSFPFQLLMELPNHLFRELLSSKSQTTNPSATCPVWSCSCRKSKIHKKLLKSPQHSNALSKLHYLVWTSQISEEAEARHSSVKVSSNNVIWYSASIFALLFNLICCNTNPSGIKILWDYLVLYCFVCVKNSISFDSADSVVVVVDSEIVGK